MKHLSDNSFKKTIFTDQEKKCKKLSKKYLKPKPKPKKKKGKLR